MKVIPKKERIEVYKKALEIITNEEKGYNYGLCILLRDLYLNNNNPNDNYRIIPFQETSIYFPEFGKYYTNKNSFIRLYYENDDLWRRIVLRLILEELKANEEI